MYENKGSIASKRNYLLVVKIKIETDKVKYETIARNLNSENTTMEFM